MEQVDKDKLLQVLGTEDLVNAFVKMGIEAQNVILKSTFKKAAQIILDQASINLGGRYRGISGSLTSVFKFGEQSTYAGPSFRRGGYLAYIVNRGTKERYYTSKKNNIQHNTGRITANYFWDEANLSTEGRVKDTIYTEIKKSFMQTLEKNNKIR